MTVKSSRRVRLNGWSLTEETARKLKEEATRTGKSVGQVMTDIVERGVAQRLARLKKAERTARPSALGRKQGPAKGA